MTTSNDITLDHINSFFSLDGKLEELNIAPTATGGAGINNLNQYPPPKPSIPTWRHYGTEYVKKYLDKEKNEQFLSRRQTLEIPGGSTISINTIDDVEDNSTALGNAPAVNELQSEATRQIYSTYFKDGTKTYDSDLVITSYREEILQQLEIHPVLIIQGPTGCGKTTQVPQYILDHYQSRGAYCNIVVTQPRKIAAMSIARRVCNERNWQLGTIIGYQVAMDARTSTDTCISYVTTGVLLEKLVNAKSMNMYTHIIIDEVHERNQEIDFALLIVKKFLKSNSPRVKVILMSATFDSSEFAEYFRLYEKSGPAPVIDIIGKSKEVTEHYLLELKSLIKSLPEFDMHNPMIDPCLYDCVFNLMYYFDKIEKAEQNVPENQPYAPARGAVLIFLPGYEEISCLSNKLQAASLNKNFWVIPLHSSITVEEQTKVFRNAPPDHRKVIISTNIAESSITVPDIKYVIDFCLTKCLVTDPVTNYTCLQLEWASKANCIQRKGRAGRVDIGRVYRLVPREFYNKFPEYGIPEIKRCPLTKTILHLKKLNICEPQEMLAFSLDPPDLSDIGSAILMLKEALALTSRGMNPFDGDLTFIGRVMSHLPLDIKLSKLIIFGYVFHCLDDCIIIAASLSLQSFFARPFQKVLDAYKSRLAWDDNTFSDCLVYLNAFKMWRRLSQQGQFKKPGGMRETEWAISYFIQIKRIKEVDLLVKEIKSRLEKLHIRGDNMRHNQDEKSVLILKLIIAGAFFPHYFLQEPLDERTIMRDINENDPHTTILVSGLPPKHGILYAAALKEMFSCCSNNMVIEIEDSKAYIRFVRTLDNSTSPVIQPVYLAVKMRKLRLPLELSVFSQEEAERKNAQILSSKHQNMEHRLLSNRITVKLAPQMTLKQRLPDIDQFTVDIYIPYMKNCGCFWAQQHAPHIKNLLNFLHTTINLDGGKNLKPLSSPPEQNFLCLAPFVDGMYYRAQVQTVKGQKVEVFYVDYGNSDILNLSDLREINPKTPDVKETPALAIECTLAEIKPFRSPSGEWSNEANLWLKQRINGKYVHAKIYSIVNKVMRVELVYKDEHGINQNVNKELIRRNLAEPAEESFASKQNHELRMKASSYNLQEPICESVPNEIEVSWQEAEESNYLQKTNRKIKLHGPYNPLEVSYCGMTNIDRSKSVKVERDSVNSVSFNPDPQEPYNALLVAATVGVGQSSHDLIARNTTLMPKMRGLPTLVCLLFSPFAEIKTNKDRSAYIGALCGLGYDSSTGESIYSDHDIELPFDINITLDDISEINMIRMGFNLLLHSSTEVLEYESAHIHNIHKETRTSILKLFEKNWHPKEPEFAKNPYHWNQTPAILILDTDVSESADHPDVFPLIKPPALARFPNKKMKDHLDYLYVEADGGSTDFKITRCELCSIDVTSDRDLLIHLDTAKHQQKEKKVREQFCI